MPAPDPPLSPIPRRIMTPNMMEILSGLENGSQRDRDEDVSSERSEEEVDGLLAHSLGPEIRTTSPSPRRGQGVLMGHQDLGALSPTHTGAMSRGSPTISRYGTAPSSISQYTSAPSHTPHFIEPQTTGQSTSTIDRAFADIHNTLDQLASGPTATPPTALDKGKGRLSFPHGYPTPPSTNTQASTSAPSNRFIPGPFSGLVGSNSFPLGVPGGAPIGLGISGLGGPSMYPENRTEARRLEAVSERTEPSTVSRSSSNRSTTPSPSPAPRPIPQSVPESPSKTSSALSAASIAHRFPLPATPSRTLRSPLSKAASPMGSPTKASDLIRMFESKSGDAPPPQPIFARAAAKSVESSGTNDLTPVRNTPPAPTHRFEPAPITAPPSSYRPPPLAGSVPPLLGRASPENVTVLLPEPSPGSSPKSGRSGTGASFKNLVASWRSRAKSPSIEQDRDQSESSGGGLSRSSGWNVSLRRRRQNEQSLAERAHEAVPAPHVEEVFDEIRHEDDVTMPSTPFADTAVVERTTEKAVSERSEAVGSISSASTRPRIVSGEAVRIGSLWYLNVHDNTKPFEWVQADARLFKEGLRLAWRTETGAQATVTFDMEYCEEVASTYSPNHPMAQEDIGSIAAKRQGGLAEDSYPFKLVYDDGTERLACTSARDRVRWVNVIWSVLEQTRPPGGARASLHVQRPTSIFSSSPSEGSASTHHDILPSSVAAFPSANPSDDAVIPTSGGLHAPIASRGSRHLAAGLERTRSLRRTASEADLSESAGSAHGFAEQDRHSSVDTPSTANMPPALTAQAVASRPVSQDFAFARQRPLSRPEQGMQGPGTPHTATSTFHTASSQAYHTPQSQGSNLRPGSIMSSNTFGLPVVTAPPASSEYAAAREEGTRPATSDYLETVYTAPSAAFGTAQTSSTLYTASQGLGSTAAPSESTARPRSDYASAEESAFSTAQAGQRSESGRSETSTVKGSEGPSGSFYSAPPPPLPHDSVYRTASPGSVKRYQLHDPPMSDTRASSISSQATRVMATAHQASSLAGSESDYDTAPPPPISRSAHSRKSSNSIYTDVHSFAKTATAVSEPDTDANLLDELERQSSTGSMYQQPLGKIQRRPAQSRAKTHDTAHGTMYTADSAAYMLANPYVSQMGTAYETARESAYASAMGSAMSGMPYETAYPGTSEQHESSTAVSSERPIPPTPPGPPSVHSASTGRARRVPVPSLGVSPTPSEPSEPSGGSGTVISLPSTVESRVGLEYDLNRMLNYLHGQDTVREGQANRMSNQLDRIELRVNDISNHVSDAPPLARSRSRSSSTSSTETARPVTPPALLPHMLAERLDEMQSQLGELIGQNRELMDEAARRRTYTVDIPANPAQARLESMLRRILSRMGDDSLFDNEPYEEPARSLKKDPSIAHSDDDEGSMFDGTITMYSGEYGNKIPAPPNSYTSEYKKRFSGVPESLLDGSLPGSEFDEDLAMQDLPPNTPPRERELSRMQVPAHLVRQRRPVSDGPTPIIRPSPIPEESELEEDESVQQDPRHACAETEPEEDDLVPMPYRQEDEYEREPSEYSEDYEPRQPARRLPPPQPVDLPTPVNSLKNMPQQPYPGVGMRPPFSASGMHMPATELPRPSLPRIAGVRDPISTTYYRRGFPAPGPMGPMGMPMGMFLGPMGIPGPGMGPFMPGLRPGMPGMNPGLGGVFGPNVGPHMRRPPMFPPGVPGATGDYGLPAASRYNNSGPSRPGQPAPGMLTPDTGLGNTTSSSSSVSSITDTTPSATTHELVTPVTAHPALEPVVQFAEPDQSHFEPEPLQHTTHTTTTISTDDSLRLPMDQATTMAQASGEQQNEMSRYLHGINDTINKNQDANEKELAQILGDLANLRNELKPKHIMGRVLPDGTVVLSNGDVVEGVRGAPLPGAEHMPPPPPSVPRLAGKVMPDGTVMVGDAIVDGIRGAPTPAEIAAPVPAQMFKDMEQDRKLGDLMDKVSELMRRTAPRTELPGPPPPTAGYDHLETASTHAAAPTPRVPSTDILREKTVIREHEIVRNGAKHVEHEHEVDRDYVNASSAPAATTLGNVPAAGTPSRVTPRTGKPLSVPQPLSLQPRDPSPIQTEYDLPAAGQLIREEHEEIIQRPGGVPVTTKATTRTYLRPDGSTFTVADPAGTGPGSGPAASMGNIAPVSIVPPSSAGMPNIPSGPARQGGALSDHAAIVEGPTPRVPYQATTSEEVTKAPLVPVADTKNTSTEHTKNPAGVTVGPTGAANIPPASTKVPSNGSAPTTEAVPPATSAADKPVWSTNGPKDGPAAPASLGNMPTDSTKPSAPASAPAGASLPSVSAGPGPAAGPAGGKAPTPASAANIPSGSAGPTAGAPSAGGSATAPAPGPSAMATPGTPKPKFGVHWDKHIHEKDAKGPDVNAKKPAGPPAASSLGNMPIVPTDKPAAGGPAAPGSGPPPPLAVGNMPSGPGAGAPSGVPAAGAKPAGSTTPAKTPAPLPDASGKVSAPPATPAAEPAGTASAAPAAPVWSTNNPKENGGPAPSTSLANTPSAPAPTLGTGKAGSGPPVVPSRSAATSGSTSAQPFNTGGKDTRFSDTTATIPPSVDSGAGSAPGSKLKKNPPGPNVLSNTATEPGGSAAAPAAPSAPSSKVVHEIPLPAPHQLEEFIMPDGTIAYIKKGTKPPGSGPASGGADGKDKGKASAGGSAPAPAPPPAPASGPAPPSAAANAAPGSAPKLGQGAAAPPPVVLNESAMGHGHCSVCCPSAPKTIAGKPVEACAHQDGPVAPPAVASGTKPAANKLTKPSGPVATPMVVPPAAAGPSGEPVPASDLANTATAPEPSGMAGVGGSNKLVKGKGKEVSPEEAKMDEARALATKQKAAAEQAAAEKAERDAIDKAKADKRKMLEDRHKETQKMFDDLKKLLEAMQKEQKELRTAANAAADKRRADKSARDKKYQDSFDRLVVQKDEGKKKDEEKSKAEGEKAKKEKEGFQAVLDAIQKFGTQEKEYLDRLGKGILEQNSKQHEETRKAAKAGAREQVAFNLSGYLDDFSKALSGEVRSLLHEVSGLRETRRALYYELAELLLTKSKQQGGDLMAVVPYPAKPPAKPDDKNKPKPALAGGDKKPAGIPAWSGWMPPVAPIAAAPPLPVAAAAAPRPLPVPGGVPMSMMPGAVPAPPPPTPGSRPLPQL